MGEPSYPGGETDKRASMGHVQPMVFMFDTPVASYKNYSVFFSLLEDGTLFNLANDILMGSLFILYFICDFLAVYKDRIYSKNVSFYFLTNTGPRFAFRCLSRNLHRTAIMR